MNLRLNEVIRMTGVGVDSIYKWAKEGKFPERFKIDGRHVRWSSEEVEEWINNRDMSIKSKKIDI